MILQTVRFRSALSVAEARQVMEERAPKYQALPGLIQKYYVHDEASGELGGVYVWDSVEALQQFRESDLAQSIADAYQVVGQSQVETFEVLFPLRQA